MNREELKEELGEMMAGETVIFKDYERFNIGATPKTLSTIINTTETEARLEATQDKNITPRQKIAIMTILTIGIVIFILYAIAKNMNLF